MAVGAGVDSGYGAWLWFGGGSEGEGGGPLLLEPAGASGSATEAAAWLRRQCGACVAGSPGAFTAEQLALSQLPALLQRFPASVASAAAGDAASARSQSALPLPPPVSLLALVRRDAAVMAARLKSAERQRLKHLAQRPAQRPAKRGKRDKRPAGAVAPTGIAPTGIAPTGVEAGDGERLRAHALALLLLLALAREEALSALGSARDHAAGGGGGGGGGGGLIAADGEVCRSLIGRLALLLEDPRRRVRACFPTVGRAPFCRFRAPCMCFACRGYVCCTCMRVRANSCPPSHELMLCPHAAFLGGRGPRRLQ